MTLLEVLTDICSRVGDVYLDRYKERAKDHFQRAVSGFLKEASHDDIPGYYLLKNDLVFSTIPADMKALQLFTVKSIHLPPGTPIAATVDYISLDEVKNMGGVAALQPTENDVFIYRVGNLLYPVVHSSPVVVLGSQAFHMWYITDFSLEGLVDGYDFSSASNYVLSKSFVRKAIGVATETLLNEVNT